jgi:hypothetical protein
VINPVVNDNENPFEPTLNQLPEKKTCPLCFIILLKYIMKDYGAPRPETFLEAPGMT